jgi:hypothetical protein
VDAKIGSILEEREVLFLINKHGGFCNFLHSLLLIWDNDYKEDYRYIPADSVCGR